MKKGKWLLFFALILTSITFAQDIEVTQVLENSVDTTLVDDAITAAKADTFLSDEVTGAGAASPTIPGLGATPSMFFPLVTEHEKTTDLNMSATADETKVYINAAETVKYKVFAWLYSINSRPYADSQ